MITVHKFVLPIAEVTTVDMPRGAQPIAVGNRIISMSPTSIELWAKVDTREPLVRRRFYVSGTGKPLGPDVGLVYVGTTILYSGSFVAHAWDTGIETEISNGD